MPILILKYKNYGKIINRNHIDKYTNNDKNKASLITDLYSNSKHFGSKGHENEYPPDDYADLS